MEPRQLRLHRHQQLRVRVATPSHLVVEVEGAPYYVTCMPKRDNPPQGGPLRPGDRLRIYNTPGPHGPTLVERLAPDGAGDGCTYLLRDYDRVTPASSGPPARGRAPRTDQGATRSRDASGRESRRAKPSGRTRMTTSGRSTPASRRGTRRQ